MKRNRTSGIVLFLLIASEGLIYKTFFLFSVLKPKIDKNFHHFLNQRKRKSLKIY